MRPDWSLLGDAPLALAVSGGADSFALLHAALARDMPVTALTVDHGLREGSAEDARVVATWCAARGVPHETLRWTGDKPLAGVQAAARAARYRLLCEACERLGLDRLATGHTLDDQAETVFMRLRRGAGRGLAAMPPRREIASGPGAPVALLRPMLGVRRAEARAYAEAHGLPVRDDPSNEDEGFERVRVRAVMGALEEQGLLTPEALARTADHVGRLAEEASGAMDGDAAGLRFLEAPTGDYDLHDDSGGETRWLVGEKGARYVNAVGEPDVRAPDRLADLLGQDWPKPSLSRRFGHRAETRKVGHGVMVVWSNPWNGALIREPAALLGRADGMPGLAPVPAPPGSRHLFDRRFVVTVPEGAPPGLVLRPFGQLVPQDIATSTLARARVSTLPVLSEGGRIVSLPASAEPAVRQALSGWKGAADILPPEGATFPARSLLAERFTNVVIRYE